MAQYPLRYPNSSIKIYAVPGNASFKPYGATLLGLSFNNLAVTNQLVRQRGAFARIGQREVRLAHNYMADEMRTWAYEQLEKKVAETGRPQRASAALFHALADDNEEGLWRSNVAGFQFGSARYLDASDAGPYWRRLEVGEARDPGGMYGRRVFARFYDSAGMAHALSADRFRADLRMPHIRVGEGGVLIQKKIPRYGYLDAARRKFLAKNRDNAWAFEVYQMFFRGVPLTRTESGGIVRG